MKLSEIIHRVVQAYSSGAPSDESRLSYRRAYSAILSARNTLISQEAKKHQKVNRWNYQTICVEMINAPLSECPNMPPIGCSILRSKNKIPKALTDNGRHLINMVSTFDGSVVYSEIEFEAKKYQKGNKYTGTKPDYYIRNEYVYVTTRNKPTFIMVDYLPEDPLAAQDFIGACGPTGYECIAYPDRDFPVDSDMLPAIVDMAIRELGEKRPQDKTNNKVDETA